MAPDLQKRGGAPGRIRTCDTRFRRAVLYPLSYEGGTWLETSLQPSLQPWSRRASDRVVDPCRRRAFGLPFVECRPRPERA